VRARARVSTPVMLMIVWLCSTYIAVPNDGKAHRVVQHELPHGVSSLVDDVREVVRQVAADGAARQLAEPRRVEQRISDMPFE